MARGVVMIVDSDRECVRQLLELLTAWDLSVVPAFDQLQACELTLQHSCDLYLIAHGLADGNGVRLFRRLWHSHPGIQGVLLAQHADLRVVYEAVGAGFSHVLQKPVDARQLSAVLGDTLGLTFPDAAVDLQPLMRDCAMHMSLPDLAAIAALSTQEIRERLSNAELICIIRRVEYPFAGKERLEYFDRDTLERVVCLVRRWSQQRLTQLQHRLPEHAAATEAGPLRATA